VIRDVDAAALGRVLAGLRDAGSAGGAAIGITDFDEVYVAA
jgi:hypothetical protein